MQTVENELMASSIISKRNSPNYMANQEKFSSVLRKSISKEASSASEVVQEVNIFMQSLQYKAQLNRMIIEHIA